MVNINQSFIKIFCITGFILLISVLNVFAGLTQAEKSELDKLQSLVEKNAELSEHQMQRWEELLLKDPDNLKTIRQKEIEKWKDELRAQGKEFDQVGIDRKLEREWKDFLVEKDKKQMNLNEQNIVLFLRQIRDVCSKEKQEKGAYPADLNTLMLKNTEFISPDLFAKVKKIYSIRYEKTSENYRVLAYPITAGQTGIKRFLLNDEIIFFTVDGSIPTLNSNRIL